MKFGDKLFQLRKKSGLSQEELGEKLGVTRQTVSKWELGQSKPDTNKLIEISKLLNIDFNVLADDEAIIENNSTTEEVSSEEVSSEVQPRRWLLILLIIIAIVIVIVLGTKFIADRRNKEENKSSIFDIFDIFSSSLGLGSSLEASIFNSKFEYDTGTNNGIFITSLIDEIITNNKKNKEHLITVVFEDVNTTDPTEIKNSKKKLDKFTEYEVSADYDEDGFINKITIETTDNSNVIGDIFNNVIGEVTESNNSNNNNSVNQFEIKSFNSIYETLYAGTINGMSVVNMLDKIITNNKTNSDHIIKVVYSSTNTTDENEIRNLKKNFDTWTEYEVILDYDDIGFVNQVTIQN